MYDPGLASYSCFNTRSLLLELFLMLQERAEDYSESLAFVRLLNKIYSSFGEFLPENGQPYLHFSDFVRTEVLGSAAQRGYR